MLGSKVHPLSAECINSSVEYWSSIPPTQSHMEVGRWFYCNPVGNSLNMENISWEVAGSPDEFIDLHNSFLLWDVKMVSGTNSAAPVPVADADLVGPINMVGSSMWQTEEVYLNNEKVTGVPQLANFANYVETVLGYSSVSNYQLQLQGFKVDTAGALNSALTVPRTGAEAATTVDNKVNAGLQWRKQQLKGQKTWKLVSRFPSELAKQPLLIPNRIDIKVVLQRAKHSFYMMSQNPEQPVKLHITSALLKLRKIKMDPEFLIAHELSIAKRNAAIYFEEKNVLELTINQGVMSFARDDLFRGIIPKKVIVALVDNQAIAGHYQKNPFRIEHCDISQIGFIVNGDNLPGRPLQFTTGDNGRDGYLSLLESAGLMFQNTSLLFDADDWPHGFSMMAFSFEPDLGQSGCLSRRRTGVVGLDIRFATALPTTMTLICIYYRDSVLEIDARRSPFLPYRRI